VLIVAGLLLFGSLLFCLCCYKVSNLLYLLYHIDDQTTDEDILGLPLGALGGHAPFINPSPAGGGPVSGKDGNYGGLADMAEAGEGLFGKIGDSTAMLLAEDAINEGRYDHDLGRLKEPSFFSQTPRHAPSWFSGLRGAGSATNLGSGAYAAPKGDLRTSSETCLLPRGQHYGHRQQQQLYRDYASANRLFRGQPSHVSEPDFGQRYDPYGYHHPRRGPRGSLGDGGADYDYGQSQPVYRSDSLGRRHRHHHHHYGRVTTPPVGRPPPPAVAPPPPSVWYSSSSAHMRRRVPSPSRGYPTSPSPSPPPPPPTVTAAEAAVMAAAAARLTSGGHRSGGHHSHHHHHHSSNTARRYSLQEYLIQVVVVLHIPILRLRTTCNIFLQIRFNSSCGMQLYRARQCRRRHLILSRFRSGELRRRAATTSASTTTATATSPDIATAAASPNGRRVLRGISLRSTGHFSR